MMLDETLYWLIIRDNDANLLQITWKNTASDMPEHEFKTHLLRFVELLRATNTKKFLVDASAGHFVMLPHMQEWHDRTIVPQYKDMGVKRIAFVYPENVVQAMSLDQTFDEKHAKQLLTRFFSAMDKAKAWIND
jgi:hypothetical protein